MAIGIHIVILKEFILLVWLLLFYFGHMFVICFSGFDVNSLKLYIIFLIFLGVEIYKSMTQQLISEKFSRLSSKQENKVLRICGTVLVIGMLALIIAIKI